jgi:hypothetical protein
VAQVETTVKKKILVAALDWGLGHATRCIPLIHRFINQGYHVFLAPTSQQKKLWKPHFPDAIFLDGIPEYAIRLPTAGSVTWHLLRDYRRIRTVMKAEQVWVTEQAVQHGFDHIVSDNRYGLYQTGILSTLLTHQLHLPLPAPLSWVARVTLKGLLAPFSELWVPDTATAPGLSGTLAHPPIDERVRYIGPLSRFSSPATVSASPAIAFLALVSGPEPARTAFQQRLTEIFQSTGLPCMIVCGQPEFHLSYQEGNVKIVPHLGDQALAECIKNAGHIVCRSGYSTLMDLHVWQRKALLVPTYGQREQEYLARLYQEEYQWETTSEKALGDKIRTIQNRTTLPGDTARYG